MSGSTSAEQLGSDLIVHGVEMSLAVLMAEVFDDVRQIRGVHVFKQLVGNVQPDTALRICFEDVTEFPPNGVAWVFALCRANGWTEGDTIPLSTRRTWIEFPMSTSRREEPVDLPHVS